MHGGAGKQLDASDQAIESLRDPAARLPAGVADDGSTDLLQRDFLPFLDLRVADIARSMREGRIEDCVTQLLILETTSHLVGADEVSLRSAALRLAVGHHRPDVGVLFAELARAARLAIEAPLSRSQGE